MSTSIGLPLSALLPPSIIQHPVLLPSPSLALLGPLPPTTPLHLALNYLALSDLPEYAHFNEQTAAEDEAPKRARKGKERALIVTSSRREWTEEMMSEDEDWMREHGGEYGVLQKLKRVDIRACPSVEHLRLFLSLYGCNKEKDRHPTIHVDEPPGLIILYDIGRLFMSQVESGNENDPKNDDGRGCTDEWEIKHGVSLSDYMEIISACKSMRDQLASLSPDQHAPQLIILEPRLNQTTSLPILKPLSDVRNTLSTPTREKRIKVKEALEWMFGSVVGIIQQESGEDEGEAAVYTVKLPDDVDVYRAKRRRCDRDELANPRMADAGEKAELTGWRWEWTM